MSTVFVYGTLMFPEILEALLNRVPEMQAAQLFGWARFSVLGQNYPGAVPDARGPPLQGCLLQNLTPQELQILNAYEGSDYTKVTVHVACGGNRVETTVYKWNRTSADALSDKPWKPECFKLHVPDTAAMCRQLWTDSDATDANM